LEYPKLEMGKTEDGYGGGFEFVLASK